MRFQRPPGLTDCTNGGGLESSPWSAHLFFRMGLHVDTMPRIVYARGGGRRQLALVWSHIQQRYDFSLLVNPGHDWPIFSCS